MSKIGITIELPTRAAMWVAHLAKGEKQSSRQYIVYLVLRHLSTHSGVDLSKAPGNQEGQ